MKKGKHAFLIIAHNNFYILEKLIKLLDDPLNDIYIHIDKKVQKFDFEKFNKIPKKSKIFFVKRIMVEWGGFSQIRCELLLLNTAIETGYHYYHLLSGVDLPLKTQNYIHDFFDKNDGKEFIAFDKKEYDISNNYRFKYYHYLQEILSKPKSKFGKKLLRLINSRLLSIQKLARVNRLKYQNIRFQKGATWFSITDNFAKYIISKEDWIKETFKFTRCCDEIFIQTLVWNSEYIDKLYYNEFDDNYLACMMRYIDWKRGSPYVWRVDDYKKLINSDYLFARKFDYNKDSNIVDRISDYIWLQSSFKRF